MFKRGDESARGIIYAASIFMRKSIHMGKWIRETEKMPPRVESLVDRLLPRLFYSSFTCLRVKFENARYTREWENIGSKFTVHELRIRLSVVSWRFIFYRSLVGSFGHSIKKSKESVPKSHSGRNSSHFFFGWSKQEQFQQLFTLVSSALPVWLPHVGFSWNGTRRARTRQWVAIFSIDLSFLFSFQSSSQSHEAVCRLPFFLLIC